MKSAAQRFTFASLPADPLHLFPVHARMNLQLYVASVVVTPVRFFCVLRARN